MVRIEVRNSRQLFTYLSSDDMLRCGVDEALVDLDTLVALSVDCVLGALPANMSNIFLILSTNSDWLI